ncbi:MAG: hypothetical protein KDB88_04145 [Flavobacteriales bacterium]|nr:hypothetical protein [Flavobacteriales bacterium]
MQEIWFGIGRALEMTFDWLLVPFGWLPVVGIIAVMSIGFLYWMSLQNRYNKRAREKGEHL